MSEEQGKIVLMIMQFLPPVFFFGIVLGGIIKATAFIGADEVAIAERLGKFQGVLKSGLRFVVPMIDQIRYRQKIRQEFMLPRDGYISNDRVAFEVTGTFSIEIIDFAKAIYGVADFRESLQELAYQALKNEIAKMERLSVATARAFLKASVADALNNVTGKWGIAITDVTIEDVRQVG